MLAIHKYKYKTMAGYYKNIIVLLLIIVPYLVFIWNIYIDKDKATLKRAMLAIGVGWVMVVGSLLLITGIDYLLADSEYHVDRIVSGISDRLMFAAMLGWVFPALVVFIAWLLHLGINKLRRRWFPHLVFKRS